MLKTFLGGLLKGASHAGSSGSPVERLLDEARSLARERDYGKAMAIVRRAAEQSPNAIEPLLALARIQLDAGRTDEAVATARQAVQRAPASGEAHFALARALSEAGALDDAMLSMERAKGALASRGEFWSEFGLMHLRRGNLELAWSKLRRALSLSPNDVPALINLAIVAQRRGWRTSAAEYLARAVAVAPADPLAWMNYGLALRDTDRLPEAIIALRRAVELRPGHARTLANCASVLLDDEQFAEAEDHFGRALAASPELIEAHVGMALCRTAQGDLDGAGVWYSRAIEAAPAAALPRVGCAELALLRGRFAEGWAAYDHRLDLDDGPRAMPFPRWSGERIESGTLLVQAEQGIGDMILFANCFGDLAGVAPKVILEAPPQLATIFSRAFPHLEVQQSRGTARPEWLDQAGPIAAAIPAGSLMRLYRPDAASFPRHHGYLQADPARVARWRGRLSELGAGPKVGLSWRGGVTRTGRKSRSFELEDLLPLLRTPGLHFVSLQYTAAASSELDRLEREHGLIVEHWQDAIDDYEETAALVAALDHVVTCCTAVAHLAGALGRPTWILAPVVPSWRYLGEGEALPWYPTARVLRNAERGDWSALMERVAREMRESFPDARGGVRSRLVALDVGSRTVDEPGHADATASHTPTGEDESIRRAQERFARGDAEAAIQLLEDELSRRGDWAEGYVALASLYAGSGMRESAHDCIALALEHDAGNVSAMELEASLLEREGRLTEAADRLETLADRKSDAPEVLEALARVCRDLKRYPEAIAACERCLACWPDRPLALGLLGNCKMAVEDYADGLAALERYVELSPQVVSAHLALGAAYLQAGRYADARAHLEWGISREPNNATARWDYALVQLADGDFEGGWPDYAFRSLAYGGIHETIHLPAWGGTPLQGERLVVLAEQGLGDEIMFSSCLPDVLARCDDVVMTCDKRLLPIFARSFPGVTLIARDRVDAARAANGRWEVLTGALPGFFRRTLADFPRHKGYLRADPARVAHWRDALDRLGAGLKIGVSWRGGTVQSRTSLRSIPLQEWGPLLGLRGAHFVNLQYGNCLSDIAAAKAAFGTEIHHFPEAIADYDETAALVSALDLIVTVCTAIVHLSGALGRPVWVLTPSAPEWRYGTQTASMPWYPSSRLFRQGTCQGWGAVMNQVAGGAAELVAGH